MFHGRLHMSGQPDCLLIVNQWTRTQACGPLFGLYVVLKRERVVGSSPGGGCGECERVHRYTMGTRSGNKWPVYVGTSGQSKASLTHSELIVREPVAMPGRRMRRDRVYGYIE